MTDKLIHTFTRARLVPVVVLEGAADAGPLANALVAGGLPVAEVTFRTAAATASIEAMRAAQPDMAIGAGTVTSLGQVDDAMSAGASFIVAPGFNPRVVQYCLDKGVLIIPGANSPSFVEAAMEFGLNVLKFFPAEPSGGVPFLKALAGPYPAIRFMPTGGISIGNLRSYLALKNVLACGGSWMVDPALIAARDFAAIERLTREAVALAAS